MQHPTQHEADNNVVNDRWIRRRYRAKLTLGQSIPSGANHTLGTRFRGRLPTLCGPSTAFQNGFGSHCAVYGGRVLSDHAGADPEGWPRRLGIRQYPALSC
jgi:hypothetical protein